MNQKDTSALMKQMSIQVNDMNSPYIKSPNTIPYWGRFTDLKQSTICIPITIMVDKDDLNLENYKLDLENYRLEKKREKYRRRRAVKYYKQKLLKQELKKQLLKENAFIDCGRAYCQSTYECSCDTDDPNCWY